MKSKVFKKANPENFNKILKRQKEEESDPKFAISDALQEYQSQLEKSAGYQNQSKLNDAKIRTDIVNYVINYGPGDLEGLKGMEFDDAKTLQKTIEKEIGEKLSWQPLPNRSASRVEIDRLDSKLENEKDWQTYIDWCTEKLEKFYHVFGSRLKNLD